MTTVAVALTFLMMFWLVNKINPMR
jgi:hypothetical protein